MAIRYIDIPQRTTKRKTSAQPADPPRGRPKVILASRKPEKDKAMPRTPPTTTKKPSAALAVIVGEHPLPRTEVVKRVWAYIKTQQLQSSRDKRVIKADATLKAVFGKDRVDMFEMNKLLSAHLS